MVTWSADGTMAGYDPVTKRLKKGLLHFATPGTVDLNAITRLNYPLGAGLSTTTYPNNLELVAPFSFTAADFTANGGLTKRLSAGMVMVRSDKFPPGHIPTPTEIFNAPYDWAQRASTYVTGGAITHTFEINLDTKAMGGFYWNTKWWVLLYPSVVANTAATWSRTNDKPLAGVNLNTIGRVLSFQSNHTPGKPTITSPVSGSFFLAGSEFTLRLNPADADEMAPEDAQKFNDDVNGVHFQYRPLPSTENPDPPWRDIPFDWDYLYPGTTEPEKFRDGMWNIRGSRAYTGLAGTPYHEALVANLGAQVVAGAGDSQSEFQPGKGAMPTGEWQIRGRTFDYGHPYPNLGTSTTQPGPLGINPTTNWLLEPAKDTYPENNKSPWSDPITVTIPAQVPPPLAISPKDNTAVSGNPVRLRWQYRNTHQPPRPQYRRAVQIRKIGDPDWSTVYDGNSSDPFVDLPDVLTQTPVPPMEAVSDGDSEAGTAPWTPANTVFGVHTFTNENDPLAAHTGSRYVKITNAPGTPRGSIYVDDFGIAQGPIFGLPSEYTQMSVDTWFYIDASTPITATCTAAWLDINGDFITGEGDDFMDSPFVVFFVSKPFSGPPQWRRLSELDPDIDGVIFATATGGGSVFGADTSRLTLTRPANGVSFYLSFTFSQDRANPIMLEEMRLDDVKVTMTTPPLDDFELETTNQYEWRARTTDTDGVISAYGTPAVFWYVPGAGTGEIISVPSETIDGATLGCGTHRVEVYRRGGKERVGELTNISRVDWSRVRDDISTAQVTISGWDIDCGNLLAKLQTWAYELVIFRDNGYSVDRVWEGPISLLTYETDKVTIDAKDVMNFAYRRIIKQKMTDSGTGNGTTVVDRARRVLQNVFAPDDPNVLSYLQVLAREDDAMQYRSTPAYSRTAYEEVDDMAANAGLDYTTVGRSIMLWGTKHRIGTLPELQDKDLGASPIVSEYGQSMANVYSVSDGNGVHGEATRGLDPVSGNNETYGLVEMLSSTWASDSEDESGTYTQAGLNTVIESFENFAERSISDRYPPPVVVRIPDNTSLNPDTVISIQHLVPGVVIPLRSTSTLRTVAESQKLDKVMVVEENGKETVSITLSPFSRDDASVGEGEGE